MRRRRLLPAPARRLLRQEPEPVLASLRPRRQRASAASPSSLGAAPRSLPSRAPSPRVALVSDSSARLCSSSRELLHFRSSPTSEAGATRRPESLLRRPSLPLGLGKSGTMGQEHRGEASGGIYTYKHRGDSGVDIHEIFVKKSRARVLLSYAGVVFLLTIVCQSLLGKESLCLGSVWSVTFAVLVAKCLQYKPVMKESVVIMPSFGVQLEVHFWSGTVDRRFIPIGKILKPLLNECVTPVTCYWSLALLLRDEEELKLVFQKFRPPVKMLVPIWKALCAFTNSECTSRPSAVSKLNCSEA